MEGAKYSLHMDPKTGLLQKYVAKATGAETTMGVVFVKYGTTSKNEKRYVLRQTHGHARASWRYFEAIT